MDKGVNTVRVRLFLLCRDQKVKTWGRRTSGNSRGKRCKLKGRSKANMFKSRWDEGLIGMCPGDKRKLTIPPEFGYGDRDVGPIKGGSTLSTSASCPASLGGSLPYYRLALIFQPSVVFETELVAIKNVKDEL